MLQTAKNPVKLFKEWYAKHQQAPGFAANATYAKNGVSLATSTKDGVPSVRTVLINRVNDDDDDDDNNINNLEFEVISYYDSQKGREMHENPRAALCFYWDQRQVRVQCSVRKCATERLDEVFAHRSHRAKLFALAKHQSQPLESRRAFEDIAAKLRE